MKHHKPHRRGLESVEGLVVDTTSDDWDDDSKTNKYWPAAKHKNHQLLWLYYLWSWNCRWLFDWDPCDLRELWRIAASLGFCNLFVFFFCVVVSINASYIRNKRFGVLGTDKANMARLITIPTVWVTPKCIHISNNKIIAKFLFCVCKRLSLTPILTGQISYMHTQHNEKRELDVASHSRNGIKLAPNW